MPPNAFILPNGKIFIFSSILPICENDDGLATVLAHELSHQLAQHSSEQLLKQPIYLVLSTILYSITGISWFNDLLINGVLTMPASREMESEADHIGCELLAKACFHPEQAINFWQRMSQAEKRLTGRTVAGMESIQTWEFFLHILLQVKELLIFKNGCLACYKLENHLDVMNMENSIISIKVILNVSRFIYVQEYIILNLFIIYITFHYLSCPRNFTYIYRFWSKPR